MPVERPCFDRLGDSLESMPSSPTGLASLELSGFHPEAVTMASSRPSASSCDLLVELQSTAGLRYNAARFTVATIVTSATVTPSSSQLPSPPSPPSPIGSSAASPASAPSAVSPPPALNTARSSPLGRRFGGVGRVWRVYFSRLKELHCGPLFGTSDEEAEQGGSDGPHAARQPSSTLSIISLFDDDSDEETVPVGTLNRLKRSDDSGDWHPYDLLSAPAKHPANGRVNHYDPAAPWDYSAPVNIEQLHDVRGESPHRCFQVEWQITPLQLSWVWEEQLDQRFARRMSSDSMA
ncbi:uncharacterized protein PITG_09919 [Phytophthora infestans T30-4]|uniref:Uncharacterized protein n=1 Tax=Phytophthora infestans (strain T30-4) TaxID=403677 RepID=D0NDU8_PHYIT|nr:uncharacterized protein PITG_09919 [Phytophthora infestans T30-4]EEY56393.1 conserved hypothetical protein [Phytophthora infestans T30-4]|eukprot:XP_002902467.1 conserved hypothetical protein [Phytophthora infestans T30-4]